MMCGGLGYSMVMKFTRQYILAVLNRPHKICHTMNKGVEENKFKQLVKLKVGATVY